MTNQLSINSSGISGSLTNLADGTSYLVAGQNISIVSQSNGSVLVSSTPGSLNVVTFLTSGSWTASFTGPVRIEGCGGGGGGSGGTMAYNPPLGIGGAGGGGALFGTLVVNVVSGTSYVVTVGSGGLGGTGGSPSVPGGSGAPGGDTLFGTLAVFSGAAGSDTSGGVPISGAPVNGMVGLPAPFTISGNPIIATVYPQVGGYSMPAFPNSGLGVVACAGGSSFGFAGGTTDSEFRAGGGGAGPYGHGGSAISGSVGASAAANSGAGGSGGAPDKSGGSGGSGRLVISFVA